MSSKKAQGWGMDIIAAVIVFFFGFVVFSIFSFNNSNESAIILEELRYDGKLILNSILSEGYPSDWNSTNLIRIGIMSDERINQTKLEAFYNLTLTGYPRTKKIFNTRFDYFIFMEENLTFHNGEVNIGGFGKPNFDKNNIEEKNLLKMSRIAIYQDKPSILNIYVWDCD